MKKIKLAVTLSLVSIMLIAVIASNSQCVSVSEQETFTCKALPESSVAIVQSSKQKTDDIDYEEILSMTKEAVRLAGGLGSLVRDGSTVVVKPNLVNIIDYTYPGWQGRPLNPEGNGTTTDWRIAKAVVSIVRELNPTGKVYVMEGSSIPTQRAFTHLKYTHENIPGVTEFIAIEDDTVGDHLIKVSLPGGLYRQEYAMNKIYKEADVLISLPCLKNHWTAVVSGAIKNVSIGATPGNIYGSGIGNPTRNAGIPHTGIDFHYWLRDYFNARPVDFAIMDGLQGIQNGPTPSNAVSGAVSIKNDQMDMRLILASKDCVALDTIESLVIGWDPRTIEYLKLLNKDGFGNIDTALISVKGKRVDEVRKKFAGVGKMLAYGGSQFSDYTPPAYDLKSIKLKDNLLSIEGDASSDTRKVDVLLDGSMLSASVTSGFGVITIPVPADKKPTTVTLTAYDYCLNACSLTVDINTGKKGDYTAFMAKSVPVIDGIGNDPAWQSAVWHPIDEVWLGTTPAKDDFSGRYKIAWTQDRLYVLAEITDDIANDTHLDPVDQYYNDDCCEVFLDEDASGGDHKNNHNAFAYHVSMTGDVVDLDRDNIPKLFNDNVKAKMTRTGSVSTWELEIKVFPSTFKYGAKNEPVSLAAGKKLGFAIAYCDSDNGKAREHFIGSIPIQGADKNVAWINASVFGSLVLR
jgi:uncharacterized protein (DUF362 family)